MLVRSTLLATLGEPMKVRLSRGQVHSVGAVEGIFYDSQCFGIVAAVGRLAAKRRRSPL